jgi:hypothetical protein
LSEHPVRGGKVAYGKLKVAAVVGGDDQLKLDLAARLQGGRRPARVQLSKEGGARSKNATEPRVERDTVITSEISKGGRASLGLRTGAVHLNHNPK